MDRWVGELLLEEALREDFQVFAGFGKHKGGRRFVRLELEAGGESGNPDLADRGLRSENEFGGAIFKEDVEHAVFSSASKPPSSSASIRDCLSDSRAASETRRKSGSSIMRSV